MRLHPAQKPLFTGCLLLWDVAEKIEELIYDHDIPAIYMVVVVVCEGLDLAYDVVACLVLHRS